MNRKYYIEFVNDDLANCYYQLVRSVDKAILRAYKDLDLLLAFCEGKGIENVVIY